MKKIAYEIPKLRLAGGEAKIDFLEFTSGKDSLKESGRLRGNRVWPEALAQSPTELCLHNSRLVDAVRLSRLVGAEAKSRAKKSARQKLLSKKQ